MPNKFAGSILASCLVFLLGSLGIVFIATASGGSPVYTLAVFAGVVFGFYFLARLINRATSISLRSAYQWVINRQPDAEPDYVPKKKATRQVQYGAKEPPSSEEVRDLKGGLNNWVPSNTRKQK